MFEIVSRKNDKIYAYSDFRTNAEFIRRLLNIDCGSDYYFVREP